MYPVVEHPAQGTDPREQPPRRAPMKTKIGDYEVATDLTRLEKIVLKNLWISAEGNGHDFGFTEDHGLADKKQAPGGVSSLVKKGYIRVHETENGYTQF